MTFAVDIDTVGVDTLKDYGDVHNTMNRHTTQFQQ